MVLATSFTLPTLPRACVSLHLSKNYNEIIGIITKFIKLHNLRAKAYGVLWRLTAI